jgi:hypothetical protein
MVLPRKVIESVRGRIWLYSHTLDRDSKIMVLNPSGKIVGYNGANETLWETDERNLYFIGPTGKKSIRFHHAYRNFGALVLIGEFLDPNLSSVEAKLEESGEVKYLASQRLVDASTEQKRVHNEVFVPYPSAGYGDDSLDGDGYIAPAFDTYTVEDVSLVSRFGAIRKGDKLITESAFQHPFFLTHKLVDDKQGGWLHYSSGDVVSIDTALYACGGIYDNYYHWLLFLIAKIQPEFLEGIDTIVTSEPHNEFQRTGLDVLMKAHNLTAIYLRDNASLHVKQLLIPQQIDTPGLDPHPCVMPVLQRVKEGLLDTNFEGYEKIYISRSDTTERKLVNESEIELKLRERGFHIVSFRGLSLKHQINLMHRARVIISPHGAGMTNVVFANQGARVLEFQNPAHVNWCMKRLAVLAKHHYGHMMGSLVDGTTKDYKVDINQILAIVDILDNRKDY